MNPTSTLSRLALAALLGGSLASAQSTERVSVATGGAQANQVCFVSSISTDGRFVAFASAATNLVPGDTNGCYDIFVRDRLGGTTERVSVDSAGAQANNLSPYFRLSLSADGRFVAFDSLATNLVAGDTNAAMDVFVHDRQSGATERVSVDSAGLQGNAPSSWPAISADGRFVSFSSDATNLVAGDTNNSGDIFVRDRLLGTTERVSVSSLGAEASGSSSTSTISGDGRFVGFDSAATNLAGLDTNGWTDVFVRDRQLGTTERVSLGSGGQEANSQSELSSLSADGHFVAFESFATNLVAGDTNLHVDIFVRDRWAGSLARVSVGSAGAQANGDSGSASLSGDGRFVAFTSAASNLVPADSNAAADIFVRDLQLGTNARVSVDPAGSEGNSHSSLPALSAGGSYVAFESEASNLVAGDTNLCRDVFVHDREAQPPLSFCPGDGSAGACPCGNSGLAGHGCENSSSTGGARLAASGRSSLGNDTLVLGSSGELSAAASIFLQGDAAIAALAFGDGLRCTGGVLKRLYIGNATAGTASAPSLGQPSISARSAALGDVLSAGSTRYYQTYYRDPVLSFCPAPQGNSWNISSGLAVVWSQ